jgi:signal peptidase I
MVIGIFKRKKEKKKENTLKSMLSALALVIIFRSLFFDNFHVPSGSMMPTLLPGDKLTASKYQYGYSKYSFPFALIPFEGRILKRLPERGDIVVFKYPSDTRINYVKRLIGLPGDRVQVLNGVVFLNGEAVKRTAISDFIYDGDGKAYKQFIEELPNGVHYNVLDEFDDLIVDNTPEYLVPEGHYFMMGDNRDGSKDSRFQEVGFVPYENLLGTVKLLFISSPNSLLNPLKWNKIRTNRIFKVPQYQLNK